MRSLLLSALAGLALVSTALALTPGQRAAILSNPYKPAWTWNFATGILPLDGSITVNSPSLGGLVTDSTGALTYAPNNLLTQSNTFKNAAWTKYTATLTDNQPDPLGGSAATLVAAGGANSSVYQQFGGPNGARILTTLWVKRASGTGPIKLIDAAGGRQVVSITSTWTQYSGYATSVSANPFSGIEIATSGDSVYIYKATASAVTYETTPRPGDQVITTTSAYYGPKFDYGNGLRIWEARTNLFLNSATGVTQSVTTTATPYTLSCWGTGTITLTGTSTAGPLPCSGATPTSSITPASLTFTPTAGTLTLTVAGSATYVNLEQASFPGPRIPTGASAVAASADAVTLTGVPAASFIKQAASAIFETGTLINIDNPRVITPASSAYGLFWNNGYRADIESTSSNFLNTLSNLPVTTTTQRIGGAWDTSGRSIVNSGVGLVSDNINNNYSGIVYIGSTSSAPDGYIRSGAIYNKRLPNSVLTSKSIVGAPY